MFSFALDVEGKRMVLALVVEISMLPFARAAAIEAIQADIQAVRLINIVEALRTIFSID